MFFPLTSKKKPANVHPTQTIRNERTCGGPSVTAYCSHSSTSNSLLPPGRADQLVRDFRDPMIHRNPHGDRENGEIDLGKRLLFNEKNMGNMCVY